MKKQNFQHNIDRLAILTVSTAEKVKKVKCKRIFFKPSENGLPNLVEKGRYLHSPRDPMEEARQWFAAQDLTEINVLFVYGVGLGYYYEAAKEWLNSNPYNFLIFLEDDLEVIHRLFESGTDLMDHSQVRLIYMDQTSVESPEWHMMLCAFSLFPYRFSILSSYQQKNHQEVLNNLRVAIYFKNLEHREYRNAGAHFYFNFYKNLSYLPNAYQADELFGKFKGIPAIVCGAGPSLDKNLALLETLSDRALIFPGATAMNAVNVHGFVPQFGVGIDPNILQKSRLIMNTAYMVPFLYRSRMNHDALNVVHGSKVYVPSSGNYAVTNWFEKKLGIEGSKVDEGFNVVNFSISLALAFGCNPIILVGVDLAYTGEKSYSSELEQHPTHTEKTVFFTRHSEEELIIIPDIHGQPVHTLWKWVCESSWIGHVAAVNRKTKFINATEGGIGMGGIPNRTLAEVAEKLLKKNWDLLTLVHGEIQNSPMPENVTGEKIQSTVNELRASLDRSIAYCQLLKKTEEKESAQKLREEEAYHSVLWEFEAYYFNCTVLERQQIELDSGKTDEEKEELRAQLEFKKFEYLEKVAELHKGMMTTGFTLYDAPGVPGELPPVEAMEKGRVSRTYYPGKQLKMESFTRQGKLHGPVSFYSEKGDLLAKTKYVNGAREGKGWYYYLTKELFSIQNFHEGEWEGEQRYFYRNGKEKALLTYRKGKLHGAVKLYFPNGAEKRMLNFAQGEREGVERVWDESGMLILEAEYKKGKPVGLARNWYENGQLSQVVTYNQDSKQVAVQKWERDGTPIAWDEEKDYYESVSHLSKELTDSLRNVTEKLIEIAPFITSTDLEQDFAELRVSLEHLQKMSDLLLAESGIPYEQLWKNPQTQKLLDQQLQQITAKLKQELSKMQEMVHEIVKRQS